jgi:hypothetical protein
VGDTSTSPFTQDIVIFTFFNSILFLPQRQGA